MPKCHSTNDFVTELALKGELMEGGVVVTPCQTNGKGQRGNSWESSPGQNLTFSVLIHPHFLDIGKQIYLNYFTALAITDFLDSKLLTIKSNVKWPNDIYVNDKKISGVLIENTLRHSRIERSVIGIGLNIHQENFQIEKAVSLKSLTGETYDLEQILEQLLISIEKRYLQLRSGKMKNLKEEYIEKMYWKDEDHKFKLKDQKDYFGIIRGVDENGKLEVEINGSIRQFDFKEIEYRS